MLSSSGLKQDRWRPSRHLIPEVPVEAKVSVPLESQPCLGDLCILFLRSKKKTQAGTAYIFFIFF